MTYRTMHTLILKQKKKKKSISKWVLGLESPIKNQYNSQCNFLHTWCEGKLFKSQFKRCMMKLLILKGIFLVSIPDRCCSILLHVTLRLHIQTLLRSTKSETIKNTIWDKTAAHVNILSGTALIPASELKCSVSTVLLEEQRRPLS